MRMTTVTTVAVWLVAFTFCAEGGAASAEKAPVGKRMTLVFAVDLSTGELQTVGNVKIDDGGVSRARQMLVKDAGKRVWKLTAGDAMAFTFELPASAGAVVLEIDEVGWAEASLAKGLDLSVNGNDVRPLPVAPARTFKTHRLTFAADKCRPGANEIAIANNERGVIGIQGVRVKSLAETGAPVDQGGTKGEAGQVKSSATSDGPPPVTDGAAAGTAPAGGTKPSASALLEAAKSGNAERVRELLGSGADIAAADNRKWTALHLAAAGGHTEVVECLLDAGLEVDRRTSRMGGGYATPLYLAAKGGHAETVKLLVERGASPDTSAMQSWTPLHIAATNGDLVVVDLLLAAGANAGALSDLSNSPVHRAAQNGHTAVVKALIEQGKADKRAVNIQGCTALHLAAENGYFETAKYLVDIGVPINGLNAKNQTPTDLCNPKFVSQWRSVKDTSRHQKVYDHLRSRGGKHAYELK